MEEKEEEPKDYFNFFVEERLPVDAKTLRRAICSDPILSKLLLYNLTEWPAQIDEFLKPYSMQNQEISVDNGILFWGSRVIILEKLRTKLLEEIHATHLGASKMKMLARQYFWFPNLDKQLEQILKNCEICRKNADNTNKANLIKFREARKPMERVHIDFLRPFNGLNYLIK